jgi:hypothetical protein
MDPSNKISKRGASHCDTVVCLNRPMAALGALAVIAFDSHGQRFVTERREVVGPVESEGAEPGTAPQ